MQVHLSALGCRLNEAELELWASEFQKKGHVVVADASQADTLVLNTCAVTSEAVRKSRKSIQRLHRENPQAKLVVSGCYVSLDAEATRPESGIDLIVTNADKEKLVTLTEAVSHSPAMPESASSPSHSALFQRNRQRAFIKIQDGCRYRCTFCIVTVARGNERSRQINDIVSEINDLEARGIREIVLTGVHVGGYGSDLETDLYTLVSRILRDTTIPRVRFASVEPWDLPEHFLDLFEDNRLLRHMHLPLQSGSDTVLRRMARRCKTADFKALTDGIRQRYTDFNITTDIIVGFPGETEQEWRDSLDFIESMNFGHIHVFNYSVREGTKAARLPDHVNGAVAKQRSRELHLIAKRMKRQAMSSMIGKQVDVLWERGKSTDGLYRYYGYTPNYHRVRLDTEDATLENSIGSTRLLPPDIDEDCLIGGAQTTLFGAARDSSDLPADSALTSEVIDAAAAWNSGLSQLPRPVFEIKPVPEKNKY